MKQAIVLKRPTFRHAVWVALGWAFLGSTTGSAATLWSDYEFNNSLTDSLSIRTLVANGGTLGATSYSFGANQGLTLSNGLPAIDEYSIDIEFQYANVGGYRKVLDFANQTVDAGLYVQDGTVRPYPYSGGGSVFVSGTTASLILTRTAATSVWAAYVNGANQFSLLDVSNVAVFGAANQIAVFFMDDSASGGSEASAGSVDRIRIWSGALSAEEVAELYSSSAAVPEASSGLLLLVGVIPIVLLARRRKLENLQ